MCNFDNQSQETKELLHLFMQKAAKELGGVNFLLSLIEALRNKKPHPLMIRDMQVASNNSIIKWNKVIFKDKVDLLENILIAHRESQEKDFNILSEPNQKKRKNIINMVKTLKPIEFVVTPQNPNDGNGFSFGVFDTVDFEKEIVTLNPIFLAMFFCSVNFTKNAIKHSL
jgi:GTPase Era involved in 16S rRNA processing